jgi:gamma-F420-2:alpha-L-glutamate ligase
MKLLLAYTEKRKTLDLIYKEWIERRHDITLCDLSKIEFENWSLYSNWKDITKQDLVFFRDIRENTEERRLIANYFKNKGIWVFDTRLTKNFATSKIWTAIDLLNNNLPYPKTYSNFNIINLSGIEQESYFNKLKSNLWNKFIMKPIDWRHWKWVYLVTKFNEFIKNHNNSTKFIYQEFIENDWDLRIIVIWWIYIGAILRKWKDWSFINNVALWWNATKTEISDELKNIAVKSVNILWIEIAWVDIIIDKITWNPYILEVNRSPEFEWFIEATGINIPAKIFDFLESKIENSKKYFN